MAGHADSAQCLEGLGRVVVLAGFRFEGEQRLHAGLGAAQLPERFQQQAKRPLQRRVGGVERRGPRNCIGRDRWLDECIQRRLESQQFGLVIGRLGDQEFEPVCGIRSFAARESRQRGA